MNGALSINRLPRGASIEDRRDFAEAFNATLDQLGIGPGEEFIIAAVDPLAETPPRAGRCRFCGEEVNPDDRHTYHRSSGYVSPAEKRVPALRQEHYDDLACSRCISRQRAGMAPTQATLA